MIERREGTLIERIPLTFSAEDISSRLQNHGCRVDASKVLVMRNRLGRSTGRAVVASREAMKDVQRAFLPDGQVILRPLDQAGVELFVEQCERFLRFSDDIKRLAARENFHRVVTLWGVPKSYGRLDVAYILRQECNVEVQPWDIVFRYKKFGVQSDECYVLCKNAGDASRLLTRVQEMAVPKIRVYGSYFGAAFLWCARSALFISENLKNLSPHLEFELPKSKNWIFLCGWNGAMTEPEFESLLSSFKMYPKTIKRIEIPSDGTCGFFMRFEDMVTTKRVFSRLNRLRRRWRLKPNTPFFAYPALCDVHWSHEDKYADEDSASDNELDEPIWH